MPLTKQGRHYNAAESASRAALGSTARTASAQSTAFDVEDARAVVGKLTISAVSGTTPTLDVSLEGSVDGTNWYALGSFPQKTAAGSDSRAFGVVGWKKARWKWTIGGTATPTFTFKIDSTAQAA